MPQNRKDFFNAAARDSLQVCFVELVDKVRESLADEDVELLRRAYGYAVDRHHEHVRTAGEPYLSHVLGVVHILADMRLDIPTLTAAMFQGVVEDSNFPLSRIEERFGEDVAHLVEGLRKITRLNLTAPEAGQTENVRTMLLAMVNDVRIVLVILADQLYRMRTLEYVEPAKQQRICRETLAIYAPLAHRLGMDIMGRELEDLAFRYLEPQAFLALQKEVTEKEPVYRKFLEEVQATIRSKLVENGIPAELEARIKGLYSLHQKIAHQQRSLEQVHDLLGVRVITESVQNCYAALGVVHQIWRPIPEEFKDYIAIPRPNQYQSLHTTVLHRDQPFEIQIRTQEMHRLAEEGVAAYWKYEGGKQGSESEERRIAWMRQIIEWSQEWEEPGEFLSKLPVDLPSVEVYAFTPKGRVLELPRGATPVDFAYAVHTEVGHQCVGAKINGRIVSLRHEIVSGDVVEIITEKGRYPNREWLSFVKSSNAKSKIRHWINIHERQLATEIGKRLLENAAHHFGRRLKEIPEADILKVASDYGLPKLEDLYAAVGFGEYSPKQVFSRVFGEPAKTEEHGAPDFGPPVFKRVGQTAGFDEVALIFKGHGDLLVYPAKCCNPIPGDEIVGYMTRGRGVAVHTRACPNVEGLLHTGERIVPVEWGEGRFTAFTVQLEIRTKDHPGMLAEITAVINSAGSSIRSFESQSDGLKVRIEATVGIRDRKQLDNILTNIRKIVGVIGVHSVYRTDSTRDSGRPSVQKHAKGGGGQPSTESESDVRHARRVPTRAGLGHLARKFLGLGAEAGGEVDPIARFHELINREMSGKASPSELDELRELETSLDEKDRQEMDSLEVKAQQRHEDLMRHLADLTAKLAALKSK
jgi:guanosine-3',5'-bis(diphosphate) 3'-pyrophosphohydrolase